MITPKQEKRFEYKGFPCVVLFMPMGYRCGYVGLPKENKYYGKSYDDIPVDCHCGLTYASDRLHRKKMFLFGGLVLTADIVATVTMCRKLKNFIQMMKTL